MQFPCFVYRSPGTLRHSSGATYKTEWAQTETEYLDLRSSGWHGSVQEAIADAGSAAFLSHLSKAQAKRVQALKPWDKLKPEPVKAVESNPETEPVADAAPTRKEIEQQATLLGIKFDGRTTDKRLLDRISAIMKGE